MRNMSGVVTAFVKTVDAQQGRIKVEYRGVDDDHISAWAPIASPMSGKDRGMIFMPEEGDEVLVAFESGDHAHPFVLGFLWNGEQVSPVDKPEKRVIVTPGGHELRFEDMKQDKRIILKSAGGHQITLEDKLQNPKVEIKTSGGRQILMDDTTATGKIQIKSGLHEIMMDDTPGAGKVEIKAGSVVTITMNMVPPSLSISLAGATVNVDATGVKVTSPAMLQIQAAGVVNVQCATANITASAATNLTTGVLNVNAAMANFSGVLRASAIQTNAVISPLYTPGLGNLI